MESFSSLHRRDFLKSVTVAAAGLAAGLPDVARAQTASKLNLKLGLDNFAVRAFDYKAEELITYAASLKTDSLFITDLKPFKSLETGYLQDLKKRAADEGLQIQLGSWSICPTSKSFRKDWGTAEEHLALGIKAARDLGSSVFRVVLGAADDRKTPGGIEARMADTAKVCKALKSQAVDAGVKIAIENHAGDMQARELVRLIEEAGKDYVGANIDPGNATWTMEDPVAHLEILGPYVLTSSMRDSMIWESANGGTVQWTAIGEGVVDFQTYFKRYAQLCPHAPVHIETISGFAREFPYFKNDFWTPYSDVRAEDFAKFVALTKKGKQIPPFRGNKDAEKAYQKGELERSLTRCKEMGLGLKS